LAAHLAAINYCEAQLARKTDGCSIIAGYHWFGDWGRDTMIACRLDACDRPRECGEANPSCFFALCGWRHAPEQLPDAGGKPDTIPSMPRSGISIHRQYFEATQDTVALQKLFPVLASMIDAHIAGTRYNIHVDPADVFFMPVLPAFNSRG